MINDKYKTRLRAMSNAELLEAMLCIAGGDDYDGGFTPEGEEEYDFLLELLHERLKDWLKQ